MRWYQLKGLDDEGIEHNSGLEVAYDRLTMTFYVAREGKRDKNKMAVYSFQRNRGRGAWSRGARRTLHEHLFRHCGVR